MTLQLIETINFYNYNEIKNVELLYCNFVERVNKWKDFSKEVCDVKYLKGAIFILIIIGKK